MYICHCRAVTDRSIKAAVLEGARDPVAIGDRCGAGTHCGGCLPALRALLADLGLPCSSPPLPVPAGNAA